MIKRTTFFSEDIEGPIKVKDGLFFGDQHAAKVLKSLN